MEVPYDPQGLKAGFAAIGVDACDVVQQLNTLPGAFHNGGYGDLIRACGHCRVRRRQGVALGGGDISTWSRELTRGRAVAPLGSPPLSHATADEQTEMSSLCWGQWELNNQPVWAVQHMQVRGACGGAARAPRVKKKSANLAPAHADCTTPVPRLTNACPCLSRALTAAAAAAADWL